VTNDERRTTSEENSELVISSDDKSRRSSLVTPEDGDPFVLEIGSEELPHDDLTSALAQLRAAVPALLDAARLSYERVEIDGTPRRLAVIVHGLAARGADVESVVKGPPADRAYDKSGKPTPAATGFAKSRGLSVDDLSVIEEGGKRYVSAVVREAGRRSLDVLAERVPDLIAGIKFEKSMRWNGSNVSFSRPLRWLVALHGPAVVDFEYAGVRSGRVTYGLRPYGSPAWEIRHAADYRATIDNATIVLHTDARRKAIAAGAHELARSVGGVIPDDPALLDEVTNLVERPTPLLGSFEERFLALPPMALVAVMRKHQRYFPVYKGDKLLPYFIAVRNGDEENIDIVRDGNEHVIRARFADAAFFYEKDIRQPLAAFVPELGKLTFQTELGSFLDKTRRLEQLVPVVAGMLGLDAAARATAVRATALAKADLATSMVVEMTSLQGVMGEIYARQSGESAAVAQAIREQYLPRFAGDAVPASLPGLALSLADKLDALSGLFAVKAIPTGSADPFGLRRSALGIVNSLIAAGVDFSVRAGLEAAATQQPVAVSAAAINETTLFVERRLQGVLADQGFAFDVVEAVLAVRGDNPTAAVRACTALSEIVQQPWWHDAFTAYARAARITRGLDQQMALDEAAYVEPVEHELHAAYAAAEAALAAAPEPAVLLGETLRALQTPINTFFERVLVNAEEETVRRARLALLQRIAQLPARVAELNKLQGF